MNQKQIESMLNWWVHNATCICPQLCGPRFTHVPVRGQNHGMDEFDWCERDTLERFIARPGALWSSNAGWRHTADLLDAAKDDPMLVAAVYVGAFAHEATRNLPDEWHGDVFRLLNDVTWSIRKVFEKNELALWHHAVRRTMPESSSFINSLARMGTLPTSEDDVVELSVFAAAINTSSHALVQFASFGPQLREALEKS